MLVAARVESPVIAFFSDYSTEYLCQQEVIQRATVLAHAHAHVILDQFFDHLPSPSLHSSLCLPSLSRSASYDMDGKHALDHMP